MSSLNALVINVYLCLSYSIIFSVMKATYSTLCVGIYRRYLTFTSKVSNVV